MTRHRALLESELLAAGWPIFTDAERVIADPVVRNRGTIGGALCQADPSEDLSAVCAAVGAADGDPGRDGERVVDMAGVPPRPVPDRGRTGRDARRDPRPAARARPAARTRRSIAGSATGRSSPPGASAHRSAAGSSAPGSRSGRGRPTHLAARRRRRWRARPPSEELFARAGALAAAACRPVSDQRGSAEYKRHVAGVLTERALLARGTELQGQTPVRKTEGGVSLPLLIGASTGWDIGTGARRSSWCWSPRRS